MFRMITLRGAVLAALVLLFVGAASYELLRFPSVAFDITDEVGRFSATFPAEPYLGKDQGTSDLGPHVHYSWTFEQEKRVFAVIFTEYSLQIPPKDYDKNVKSLLDKGAKLLRQSTIDLGGVDGHEVYTELPEREVLRQRMFLVGNRLYQVVYQGPFGTESRDDVEAFMQSFQLLE